VLHPNGKGDRVFYADTASRRVFVKRIIGLPGDWVKARHGRVSICTGPGGSGCVPLDEPYVRARRSSSARSRCRPVATS